MNQDRLSEMLDAFAGPESPASQPRRGRHATRRTFVLLAAGVAALGLAVPGSLALLGGPETPKQFFSDAKQPANAKRIIREMFERRGFSRARLLSIANVITARTPDGELRVYALRLPHGSIGTAVISSKRLGSGFVGISSRAYSAERLCPSGWAMRANGGGSARPGRTYSYVIGNVSRKVASVHVLYRDGTTTPGAVGGGYFLAWVEPRAAYSKVTLVAENPQGRVIAKLKVGGMGGVVPRPGVPRLQEGCG